MGDFIDRSVLLADLDKFAEDKQWRNKRTLRERWLRKCGIDIFRKTVKAFPTADVVEVVRCKDCEHYDDDGKWCNIHSHFDKRAAMYGLADWNVFSGEDFCSCGERKSE